MSPDLMQPRFLQLPILLSALLLAGCGAQSAEKGDGNATVSPSIVQATGDTVVARYEGGTVTADDLDRTILQRGLAKQAQEAADRPAWMADLARRLVVERLLLEEAELVGADRDPEMQQAERQIRRDLYSEYYLREHADQLSQPTKTEVEAYFQENLQRYQRPEQRQTYHIFKRASEARTSQDIEQELLQLRERFLAGEPFALLAREHSDSETRHRDGLLGNVERGIFPAEFDEVLFNLQEGVPSQPLVNAEGGHLLLVSTVLEARSFQLEEVQASIVSQLEQERRGQHLRQLAEALPEPADSFVPDRAELSNMLRAGDAAAILLRLGDYQLTLGQFLPLVQQARRSTSGRPPRDLAPKLLNEIRMREQIYQHLQREGLPELPEGSFQQQFDRVLIDHVARRQMTALVERDPQIVQNYYSTRQMRYSTSARLHLRRLALPAAGATAELMAELEQARAALDAGTLDLEQLAQRHGAEIEEKGPLTAGQLRRLDPAALRFAFLLEPGEHSPPYSSGGDQLVIFQVTKRQEPEAQALAVVRDRVVRDYLSEQAGQVFQQLSQELLDKAGFELVG